MRAELHCHSDASFDAFSTPQQILQACVAKGIDVLAITEHDVVGDFPVAGFAEAGVQVIRGCEYTSVRGAHVIGLFIRSALPAGRCTPQQIIAHIRSEGGLVLLPHPFKPGSGYFAVEVPETAVLDEVDLVELVNGGYRETDAQRDEVRVLAGRHDWRLVACSDAHKIDQIGFYVTEFSDSAPGGLQAVLREVQGTLMRDAVRQRPPRRVRAIQRVGLYQRAIAQVPYALKHAVKRLIYRWSTRRVHIAPARYEAMESRRGCSS